jgi:hypothetical protein
VDQAGDGAPAALGAAGPGRPAEAGRDFAKFTQGQVDLVPQIDLFNRCQYNVVLPTGEEKIQDGSLSTGLENYKEFWQIMVALSGESSSFDGNGSYTRFQAGGGGTAVSTGAIGQLGPAYGNATAAPRARCAATSRPTSRRSPATSRARPT